MLAGATVHVFRAAVWHNGRLVAYENYSYKNPEVPMSKELPRYKSHKEVRALKIQSIARDDEQRDKFVLVFQEHGHDAIKIDGEMTARYMPKTGDYFVIYEDGYKSFSPAAAFESGYTRIAE